MAETGEEHHLKPLHLKIKDRSAEKSAELYHNILAMWPARFLLRVPALPARVPHLSRPFQSPAHPEKLYPGSTWDDRFISNEVPKDERGFNGHIPMKDLQVMNTPFRVT